MSGNVVKEIDPAGNVKIFEYNKLDKITKKVLPDDTYEFSYDSRGNVTMVKNAITQINFEYEHLESGDVVSVAGTFGVGTRSDLPSLDLEYEYDVHGNRVALIDGDEVTNYEYDIGNRLRKITNHKNEVFTFDYDSKNRLKLITRPGSETSYSFHDNDILSQILHKSGTTTISSFDYLINGIGNITQKRTPAGDFDYGYDGNNQLIGATNPETAIDEVYQYDSLGNRTSDQGGSYTYDQTGQKLQEDYKNLYYYDSNGNLSSKIEKSTNKTTNFIYNSENRLIEYKEFDEQANLIRSSSYAYDALGRRIEKVVTDFQVPANNKTKRYVYDGEDILLVLNENNETISKYTHSSLRIDDALAIDNKIDDKSYYFLKDHLGSIVDIVNDDLSFKQHYAYSSFGELQKVTDIGGNDVTVNPILEHHFAYTGREYDQESGLYHYRARAYYAETGRFLQTDPHAGYFKIPLTVVNKYGYASNNPMKFVDPSGEIIGVLTVIAVSAVVGGAVNKLNGGSFWKGFVGGMVASSAVIGLAYGGAFLGGTALGMGASGAFWGGVIGGALGGGIGAQLRAKIVHGRNATKGELALGIAFGATAGGVIGASYGSNLNTTPLEPGSQIKDNIPSNDIPSDLDWHFYEEPTPPEDPVFDFKLF